MEAVALKIGQLKLISQIGKDRQYSYLYKHHTGNYYKVEVGVSKDARTRKMLVSCDLTGYFEVYGLAAVKNKLRTHGK